jgi:hypothetical protein
MLAPVRAFSSEVDPGSHSNQVYADCVDLSAVENASKQKALIEIMIKRWFGWSLLMLFTGLATAWLRGVADPWIPAGDWHGLLSGLFVVVVWPSLAWSLRQVRHLGMSA